MHLLEVENQEDLKLYIKELLSNYKPTNNTELGSKFYFPDYAEKLKEKSPIEAGVPIELIIEKAKAMINSSIYLQNTLVLPFAPDRLKRIYYDFSSFMSISFSLISDLAYLFSMPFIVDYDNITDDNIFIIFVYYGIMFNDSSCKNILKERNSTLSLEQKEKIEKKVFHYIKDYTNSTMLPILEKISFRGGKELEKMINRLLNTFIEYSK